MGIKRWLKEYFIPHEHNDHRPRILRTRATIAILAIVLLIEACFLAQTLFFSKTGLFATILQNVLIVETNGSRTDGNLPTLRENPLLDGAAQLKAEDMAEKGYFAHTSPEGVEPWHWFKMVGYDYSYAGENLAVNFSDSEDVVRAWLNSPAHRQNILSKHFTEIGIGTAAGTYEGRETVFIVQMFGTPAQPSAVEKPVVAAAPPTAVRTAPPPAPVGEVPATVQGAETAAPRASAPVGVPDKASVASAFTWWVAASPKTVSNYFYIALMVIVALALLLNVAIKPRIQHPHLILNGVVMLLVINSVLLLNYYFASLGAEIL